MNLMRRSSVFKEQFNQLKEIAIYETARVLWFEDYENCSPIVDGYIDSAKQQLRNLYPDIDWTTEKYGP